MITEIVKRAMFQTVTNIGQLSDKEVRELNRAVKAGLLQKGKGGPFPILKTVYAVPSFDIAADRQREINRMRLCQLLDAVNGVSFGGQVKFQ